MVSSFGANAHVVEIIVDSSGVYYQVIGADRRLHIRDYSIVESEIDAGTYGYNRKTGNFVRAPTAAESHNAVLTLGQVDPGVVDSLYSKVGFPRQGSSATLTGRSWFLQSGAQTGHRFVAAYNGNSVQRTQTAAPPDPKTTTIPTSTQATPGRCRLRHRHRAEGDVQDRLRRHDHDLIRLDQARQAQRRRPAPVDVYHARSGRREQDRRVSAQVRAVASRRLVVAAAVRRP